MKNENNTIFIFGVLIIILYIIGLMDVKHQWLVKSQIRQLQNDVEHINTILEPPLPY